jgi:hypothetical protein
MPYLNVILNRINKSGSQILEQKGTFLKIRTLQEDDLGLSIYFLMERSSPGALG